MEAREFWEEDEQDDGQSEQRTGEERQPEGRPRFSLGSLGKRLAVVASNVGESIARKAAAAGELITDAELRSKLAESAGQAAAGVAKGLQRGAGRIAAGPRTVQGILQKLQAKIEEQRLTALLQEQQDTPVDVQVAFQLYEDAPQELRSRLWMAVLEHPELCKEYQNLSRALQQERLQAAHGSAATSSSPTADAEAAMDQQRPAHDGLEAAPTAAVAAEAASRGSTPADGASLEQAGASSGSQQQASSDASQEEPCQQEQQEQSSAQQPAGSAAEAAAADPGAAADPAHLSSSYAAPWAANHHHPAATSNGSSSPSSQQLRQHHQQQQQEDDAGDGWQLVNDQGAARKLQGQQLLAGASGHLPYSREREGFRNILMTAMMSIPWPLPSEYPPDCRYSTLLQISVGQEDIDEVISRDIHRTFPEHPLFAFEQGQQALFNLLKAYALHDIEVAYCQGMAFVAGLLLFYVPEEPAFQLFCRLMTTSGPNLRRLYLPGLEGLKSELRKLDFLLERFLPNLTAHLNAAGVVPVLFASQWFLTAFSCPFPVSFACRLVDVMLQDNSDTILLKAAVAILAECEGDLLMQEDFEELLTFLKVEPVQWSPQRLRRVLNAAIASPITQQDLADAEAALQQGFTGSLSRVPTFSADSEAALPSPEAAEASDGAAAATGGGPVEGAAAMAAAAARHTRSASAASQPSAAGAEASASLPPPGSGAAAGAGTSEDAVAAELATAHQQMEEELFNMVLMLDLDLGGEAAENYAHTLHTAVQAGSSNPSHGS